MCRVHTARIIAPRAGMKNEQSIGHRAISKFPGKAMRTNAAIADTDISVTIVIDRPCPKVAFARTVNPVVESLDRRDNRRAWRLALRNASAVARAELSIAARNISRPSKEGGVALLACSGNGSLTGHDNLQCCCAIPPAVSAARGLSAVPMIRVQRFALGIAAN
jgi:hypothetical protein